MGPGEAGDNSGDLLGVPEGNGKAKSLMLDEALRVQGRGLQGKASGWKRVDGL